MAVKDSYVVADNVGITVPATAPMTSREKIAIRFTATLSYTMAEVLLKLWRVGTPGTITLRVYSDNAGSPDTLLASGTYNGDTLTTDASGAWVTISLGAGTAITTSNIYWIILDSFSTGQIDVNMVGARCVAVGSDADAWSKVWQDKYGVYIWDTLAYDAVFKTSDGVALVKPTTPDPANGAGPGVDFSDWTFSWANGGGAIRYNIYAGISPGVLNLVAAGVATETYQIPVGSPYRTSLLDDSMIYWRVDASDGSDTVTGDEWHFDPRPAKTVLTTPANEAVDQTLHTGAEWNSSAVATSYTFRIIKDGGLVPTLVTGLTGTDLANIGTYLHLDHDTKYYWRVDAVNQFGTTEGDAWWFRTFPLHFVLPSWELLPGRTLTPLTGGVVGIDFRWLGDNNMVTTKRLVVAAYNRIWFEDM